MRVVLQRVTQASVKVDGEVIGAIGNGFLILLGVSDEDNETVADKMADKICKLRIFGKKWSVKIRTDHIFVYNPFLSGLSVISVS